ncbi:Uncharacterised protein [Enterobacter cloacae]|nr:Uncharacterised protein [Enterobacter cloacae]
MRLWVVQAAAQAGEQFAALFRGDAVVVELGGVDEAGVALDRRFAETQDGEFSARVALDYRCRRAAAVVRRAALVPAAGAAPEFQLATVGQLQRRRGRAEGGAAAVAVAGRVDTVEQLEFRHRLQVHAVPVQRHVVVGEDVVLGALLFHQLEHRAERPQHHFAEVVAVAGQALGVGEGGEAAQEQQVVAARQALEPLRRQLADVHAGAAGLQQQAEARLVALFVAQRRETYRLIAEIGVHRLAPRAQATAARRAALAGRR